MKTVKDNMVSLTTMSPESLHDFFLQLKKICKENVVEIAERSLEGSPVVRAYILGEDDNILTNGTSTKYCIETGLWLVRSVMRFEYVYDSKHHLLLMFNLPEELRKAFFCTVTLDYANPTEETLRDLCGLAVYEKLHTKYVWMDDVVSLAQEKYHHFYPTEDGIVKNIATIRKWLAYEDLRNLVNGMNIVDNRMCFCPITTQEASTLASKGQNAISVLIYKGIQEIEQSIKNKERKNNYV